MLQGLVLEVVVGMAHEMRAESKTLQERVRALSDEPNLERLRAAQRAFERATLAWKRAYAFRVGPFASSEAFTHAAFWPVRPTLVDGVLGEQTPLGEQRVEQLGVDARGLYALEYLLFEREIAVLAADARAPRMRAYALELSANILGYAERIERLLGDGSAYAASFAKAGQSSVRALVSQLLDTLTIVSGKFARLERARTENMPLPFAVEGHFSKSSLEIVIAMLAGAESLYLGAGSGGLSALVAVASRAIDDHVRAAFLQATRELRALALPLEVALEARPIRFKSAAAAVAELKHVVEVELVSALAS